jgi:chromosome segregation ATPase
VFQVAAESKLGNLDDEVRGLRTLVEDLNRQVHDLGGVKARLTQENFELHRQVQELDTNNGALTKAKALLQQQLDDAKNRLDEESRVSQNISQIHTTICCNLYLTVCRNFYLPHDVVDVL